MGKLRITVCEEVETGLGEVRAAITCERTGRWVVTCMVDDCGFGTAMLNCGAATERAYLHVAVTHGRKQ